MDLRPPSEIAALKADSFGRISLMQGGDGPFVRRDLAHVPLWLRLPAWWLARTYHMAMMPGVKRKLRLIVDWTVGIAFGRDTAELGRLGHPPKL